MLLAAALVGALSALAALVLEAAEAAGISGFSAINSTILREEVATRFGTVWALGAVAWLLFGGCVAIFTGRARRAGLSLRVAELGATGLAAPSMRSALLRVLPLLVPAVFLILLPALSGHGSTQSPVLLSFPVNVLHVGGMAIWLGGLAALLLALPAATRALQGPDRSRLLAAVLARFSQVALIAVAVILATGLLQAYVYVRHPGDLITAVTGGRC